MKKPGRGDIVFVVWTDIEHHYHGWPSIRDARNPKLNRYEAVGWVVRRSRKRVTLTPVVTLGQRKRSISTGCFWTFPRGSILKVEVLHKA